MEKQSEIKQTAELVKQLAALCNESADRIVQHNVGVLWSESMGTEMLREVNTVRVDSGDGWVYGFGVIRNNGLYAFKEYKNNCIEVRDELAATGIYHKDITIEPVKVRFSINGNIRIWERNNKTI